MEKSYRPQQRYIFSERGPLMPIFFLLKSDIHIVLPLAFFPRILKKATYTEPNNKRYI